ncbi:MAG: tetratricopeptide repeat protein [Pirellulaceae bacterium]|nr:tetratricopeptide repeat protein [Pirellulaceae bacterium]
MRFWLLITAILALPLALRAAEPAAAPSAADGERAAKIAERDRLWTEALAFDKQKKHAEALERGLRVLEIERGVFGNHDQELIGTLTTLAEWHERLHDWPAARAKLTELLALRARLSGADHWRTTDARLLLEKIDRLAKLPPDKLAEYRAATDLLEQVWSLSAAKKFREALLVADQSAAAYEAALGRDSRDAVGARSWGAYMLFQAGDYAAALPRYQEVAAARKGILGEKHPDSLHSQKSIGQSLYNLRRFGEAATVFAPLPALFEAAEAPDTAAWMDLWLGDSHRDQQNDAAAVAAYSQGAQRFAKLQHDEGLSRVHTETGRALYRLQKYADALPHFERARRHYMARQLANDAAWMLLWKGHCQFKLADYPAAIETYRQTCAEFEQQGDLRGLGEAEYQWGRSYYFQSKYAEALDRFTRNVATFEQAKRPVDAAWSIAFVGYCARELKDEPAAIKSYERALAIFVAEKIDAGRAKMHDEWGRALYRQKQYLPAIAHFEQATQQYEAAGEPDAAAWMIVWQGYCRRDLAEPAVAAPLFAVASERFAKIKHDAGLAQAEFEWARALYRQKQYAESLPHFERAALSYAASKQPVDAAWMHSWRGDAQWFLGQIEPAIDAYEQSLAAFVALKHNEGIAVNSRELGKSLAQLERWTEAVPHLERAAAAYNANKDLSAAADCWSRLGRAHKQLREFKAAEDAFLRMVEIERERVGEEHGDYARAISQLATYYSDAGRITIAKPLFLQALEIRKKQFGPRSEPVARSLQSLADLYENAGDLIRAEDYCRQAMELFKELFGERFAYVSCLETLVQIGLRKGDYVGAEAVARQSLALREQLAGTESSDFTIGLHSLAITLNSQGRYVESEGLLRRAIEIITRLRGKQHADYAAGLNNLALLYADMGDLNRAEPLLRESLEVKKLALGDKHPAYAVTLVNIAAVLKALDRYDQAAQMYTEAREIFRRRLGTRHPDYLSCLTSLAGLMRNIRDYEGAEALLLEVRRTQVESGSENLPDFAYTLNNLGELYAAQKDFGRAEALVRQASELWQRLVGDKHPLYAKSLSNLALLRFEHGNLREAFGLAVRSLKIKREQLQLVADIQSERQQLLMMSDLRGTLDVLITIARRDPKFAAEAYDEVLAYKGLVLQRQRAMRAGSDQPELAPLLVELRGVTSRLATLSLASPPDREIATWREEIASLSDQKERLEARLSAASREFRSARQLPTLTSVRAALPAKSVVVDVMLYFDFTRDPGGDFKQQVRYGAFVVAAAGEIQFVDLGTSVPIDLAIQTWREDQGRTKKALAAAQSLRDLVWQPLAAHLAGRDVVLLCPDGELSKFPWPALPGEKPGAFLIEEDRLIAMIPAAQALPELLADEPGPAVPRNLLVMGAVDYDHQGQGAPAENKPKKSFRQLAAVRGDDDLKFILHPGMEAEPRDIARKYEDIFGDDQFTLLEGAAATENAVRTEGPRHLYLHFATHGFFAPPSVRSAMARETVVRGGGAADLATSQTIAGYHPGLLSGIALAGANQRGGTGDDGILTAEEVGTLDLSGVRLVVLSACETGLGETAGGEGLLGLQRSFQAAGARTVIASLWKVPDAATRDLMERFYDNLWNKEMSKLAALREAQLWVLRERGGRGLDLVAAKEDTSNRLPPHYWAAFILSGDWR